MKGKNFIGLGVIFLTLWAGTAMGAEPAAPAAPTQAKDQAMAIVDRMSEFLSGAKSLSVTMDTGFDSVQDSGQKIEFGEVRQVVLDRPGFLRVDATTRNGKKSRVSFNGKDLTLFYEQNNVYASDPKTGTVDDAIKYFTEDLGLRLPLAMMLTTKLKDFLDQKVREAAIVEDSFIAGVPCDHLALRGDEADMQLWIAKGDKPLPQRIVITYKQDKGAPQFWAQLSNWNLAPEIPEGFFAFTPPADAKKIAFSPKQTKKPEESVVKAEVKS